MHSLFECSGVKLTLKADLCAFSRDATCVSLHVLYCSLLAEKRRGDADIPDTQTIPWHRTATGTQLYEHVRKLTYILQRTRGRSILSMTVKVDKYANQHRELTQVLHVTLTKNDNSNAH